MTVSIYQDVYQSEWATIPIQDKVELNINRKTIAGTCLR